MELVTIFAILATISGSAMAFSNIFQAIKIFQRKSASDVSKLTYAVVTFGSFIWILYGIEIKSFPIVISNAIGIIITITILVSCFFYGNKAATKNEL